MKAGLFFTIAVFLALNACTGKFQAFAPAGGESSSVSGQGSPAAPSSNPTSSPAAAPSPAPSAGPSALPAPKSNRILMMLAPSLARFKKSGGGSSPPPSGCKPPRHYQFTLGQDVPFGCDSTFAGRTVLFNPRINDAGSALARAELKIKNNYSISAGWSAHAYLGAGGGIDYDMADNIAPGDARWKTVLGSAQLTPGSQNVRVSGYNYNGLGCVTGGMTVLAESRLDVWVEDERPECKGKYLGLKSLHQSGDGGLVAWDAELLTIDIPPSADSSEMLIMSSVEGTINPCAAGSLHSQTSTPFHSLIGERSSGTISVGPGMCHTAVATSNWVSYSPSVTRASLHVMKNVGSPVYSGGRGGGSGGEAWIGFVKK